MSPLPLHKKRKNVDNLLKNNFLQHCRADKTCMYIHIPSCSNKCFSTLHVILNQKPCLTLQPLLLNMIFSQIQLHISGLANCLSCHIFSFTTNKEYYNLYVYKNILTAIQRSKTYIFSFSDSLLIHSKQNTSP